MFLCFCFFGCSFAFIPIVDFVCVFYVLFKPYTADQKKDKNKEKQVTHVKE